MSDMCSYKRLFLIFPLFLAMSLQLSAQTVAENFMSSHKNIRSAKYVEAKGTKLSLVRPFLSKRSIAPVLEYVEGFSMLKMQNVDEGMLASFRSDLDLMLKSYTSYGRWNSQDGIVDIFVNPSGPYHVEEIVIYNPHIMTLYSIVGKFPVERLLLLDGAVG